MSINIYYGHNQNRILSNLSERLFIYKEVEYRSVEHAYQTLKSGTFDRKTYSKSWKDGTKHIGKAPDKEITLRLMTRLIEESLVQNPRVLEILIETRREKLTHYQDKSVWNTLFPLILESIRFKYKDHFVENKFEVPKFNPRI